MACDIRFDRFLLLGLGLLLIASGIGLRDPWRADEPRFALIARDMVLTGEWLLPHVSGDIYADKPPLFFWLIALGLQVTDSLRAAFLLPSLLSSLGCVLLIYDLARRLWNRETGLLASALLLLTVQFVWQARQAQIDATLCFWTTLSLYGLLRHLLLGPQWRWHVAGWAAAGLGVITKGVGFLPLPRTVLVLGRDAQSLQRLARSINLDGNCLVVHVADIAQARERDGLAEAARTWCGGVNVLVNSAGVASFGAFAQMHPEDLERAFAMNVLAPMQLCHTLLPHLERQPTAHIVNIGSVFGAIGYPGHAAYSASKFALRGFSEALRRELGDTVVRVHYLQRALAINPDGVDPNFFYGEFLFEQDEYGQALAHLQKALHAPPRPAASRQSQLALTDLPAAFLSRGCLHKLFGCRFTHNSAFVGQRRFEQASRGVTPDVPDRIHGGRTHRRVAILQRNGEGLK